METLNIVYDSCRHYVSDSSDILGPDLTNQILGWLRSRSVRSLTSVSSSFNPLLHDWRVLKTLLQVEAFFKKFDDLSQPECSEVALRSFLENEELCRETNLRLDDHLARDPACWITRTVGRMQAIVARTLGPKDAFHEELPLLVRSTNGATAARPRSESGGPRRIHRSMYATEMSRPYLDALARYYGYVYRFRNISHNRVELVPKNWKTHRTIACEPEGNVALQLAFDDFCKRRLLRLGVDLSSQSRNQDLCREASVHGKLCTVDLKAASDSLSLNCVHLLFEREWVDFFLMTRSPRGKLPDGKFITYQKLSSMGNGYTFTVETLVFAAACVAIGSKQWAVYGDDIVVESHLYHDLVTILAYLGFSVNDEKSHHSGLYRESCGVHMYAGHDVTPFFCKSLRTKQDIVLHVNNMMRAAPLGGSCWSYVIGIVRSLNLPLVPLNSDPCSGVFIHPSTCYDLGLIRTVKSLGPWQPAFKGFKVKPKNERIHDSRALFLWFLNRRKEPFESSRYSLGTRKFGLKWVRYFPVMGDLVGGSVRLHWWTEAITSREG